MYLEYSHINVLATCLFSLMNVIIEIVQEVESSEIKLHITSLVSRVAVFLALQSIVTTCIPEMSSAVES